MKIYNLAFGLKEIIISSIDDETSTDNNLYKYYTLCKLGMDVIPDKLFLLRDIRYNLIEEFTFMPRLLNVRRRR